MTEIKMSNEGVYAITIKGIVLILLAWIFVLLLYSFIQIALGYQRLNENTANVEFLGLLFIASMIITTFLCLIIGKMLQAMLSIETKEKEILIRRGLFLPRETKISYSELKEARLSPTFLDFIDNLFGICAISIEDSKVIGVNGVKNAIESVKEINDRIAVSKRKGITFEDLAKEVKALRDEIETLKAALNVKKMKEAKKETSEGRGRGKFGIGPLEEGV